LFGVNIAQMIRLAVKDCWSGDRKCTEYYLGAPVIGMCPPQSWQSSST